MVLPHYSDDEKINLVGSKYRKITKTYKSLSEKVSYEMYKSVLTTTSIIGAAAGPRCPGRDLNS